MMAKPWIHSMNSAKKFGGKPEDYMQIHEFMDSSKSALADNRHRTLTHNSWFISIVLPRVFGETFTRESDGGIVSVRNIGEQHVLEDFGMKFIPSAQDYLEGMEYQDWMDNGRGAPPSFAKIAEHRNKKPKIYD